MFANRYLALCLSAIFLAVPAVGQENDPHEPASPPAQKQEQAKPETEDTPADKPKSREVTIGPNAPDPLDVRQVPKPRDPARDNIRPVEDQDVLGVPALELKIDPRTLGIAPGDPLPPLMREGEFIRNRDARLIPTNERGNAVVVVAPPADAGPDAKPTAMIVAPNRMLESMETLQESRGENLRFTITGQVHTYRGVNYLLVTSQPRPWLLGNKPKPEAEPELAKQAEDDQDDAADATPSPTPPTDPTQEDQGEASSEDVLRELLNRRSEAPTSRDLDQPPSPSTKDNAPAIDPRPLVQGVAPDQPMPKLYDEGSFILNRAARIVRSGDGSHPVLIFDADDVESAEPPMVIQNCKLLEQMEAIVATHGDHVPFVITGQVQTYRGANYLLPSMARLQFDLQNTE